MKAIQHANKELLHLLFEWKRRNGQMIRFSIKEERGKWIVSFFSVDRLEREQPVFAAFTGKNHDELQKWAIGCLADYRLTLPV